jgi:uncharacterized coiled-coil protein SlyX
MSPAPNESHDGNFEERIAALEGRVTSLETSRAARWERIRELEDSLAELWAALRGALK